MSFNAGGLAIPYLQGLGLWDEANGQPLDLSVIQERLAGDPEILARAVSAHAAFTTLIQSDPNATPVGAGGFLSGVPDSRLQLLRDQVEASIVAPLSTDERTAILEARLLAEKLNLEEATSLFDEVLGQTSIKLKTWTFTGLGVIADFLKATLPSESKSCSSTFFVSRTFSREIVATPE